MFLKTSLHSTAIQGVNDGLRDKTVSLNESPAQLYNVNQPVQKSYSNADTSGSISKRAIQQFQVQSRKSRMEFLSIL